MKKDNQIIFYKSDEGDIKIDVKFENETIWLSQKQMGELFDCSKENVILHLKNIFKEGELSEKSVTKNFLVTASDGKNYNTKHYNLDTIIAVGYRVNSKKATQFRIWATNILNQFIIKGFVMDDERLKNGEKFGKDYFEELLERIRDIRSSERRFYQKLTDLFSLSADYDKDSEITKQFFATIQNKLHFAISGNTAPEIIYSRVDSDKQNMGLTNWKTLPYGKIMKSDVTIAKNYLNEKELKTLNLLINAYLDIAEMQTMDEQIITMQDWKERIDEFLKGARKDILENAGKITKELAKEKAEKEYNKFKPKQDLLYKNDFDYLLEELKQKKLK